MEKIVVSMRIDREMWKMAKKYAIDKDLSIGQFVETAILHEVQKNGQR
jgi:predicted HicB family RNase H-like nuclease